MKLVSTSAICSENGDRPGGLFLIDLDAQTVEQPMAQQERSLRGITFDGDTVYLATDDTLVACNPRFESLASWQNRWLQNCQQITVYERTLYVVSAGFDSIIGFDLVACRFHWAMHIMSENYRFAASAFDPEGEEGPLLLEKLSLNSIHCNEHGMYIGGASSGGLLHFNGKKINMGAELPAGSHDARPFRDGVLFNDTQASALRYAGRNQGNEDRAIRVPGHDEEHRGFARGLCTISGSVVAGGSSPATISIYDLAGNERLLAVSFARDPRHAIHSIAVWPFA